MAKRFIDSDLFRKRFIRGLKGPYKLLWVYLFCDCDNAGIWEVDIEAAELFTGQKYSIDEAKKAFDGKIYFFNNETKVFIPDFIVFQYGNELNEKNSAHRSVIEKLTKYQLLTILNEWNREGTLKPLSNPQLGGMDKDKEAGKIKVTVTKGKNFVKPTLEEVTQYCKERNNQVDPQQWIDHYTANGWKVGKNPMKDWKAAVRTWEKNNINNSGNGSGQNRPTKVSGNTKKKNYTGTL